MPLPFMDNICDYIKFYLLEYVYNITQIYLLINKVPGGKNSPGDLGESRE